MKNFLSRAGWIILGLLAAFALTAPHHVSAAPAGPAADMFGYLNGDRAGAGLPALTWNDNLGSIAQDKLAYCGGREVYGRSQDMANLRYFDHTIYQCGENVDSLFKITASEMIGENTAPLADSAKMMNDSWMKDMSARDDILMADFTEVGIGAAKDAVQGWVKWTVLFARATPAPAPTAAPPTAPTAAPAPAAAAAPTVVVVAPGPALAAPGSTSPAPSPAALETPAMVTPATGGTVPTPAPTSRGKIEVAAAPHPSGGLPVLPLGGLLTVGGAGACVWRWRSHT